MLRRNRQIKMQIQQLLDSLLFGVSFWLAWALRSNPVIRDLLRLDPVRSYKDYMWMYVAVIIVGPLLLQGQGFYERPLISGRRIILWPLFKGCFVAAVMLIMLMFFMRVELARTVTPLFGGISFILIMVKEEFFRSMLW